RAGRDWETGSAPDCGACAKRRPCSDSLPCCGFIGPRVNSLAPIGVEAGPVRVSALQPDAANAVILEAADIQPALVLAHRGDGRMQLAGGVPQAFNRIAIGVELDDAAVVQARIQPLIARDLLDHAQAE